MKAEHIQKILSNSDKYPGGLDAAIAEHLMGEAVMIRSGGHVPAGADLRKIDAIRSVVRGDKVSLDMSPFSAKIDAIINGK